jgi:hypothetical protein
MPRRVAAFGDQHRRQQHFYLLCPALVGECSQSAMSSDGIIKAEAGKSVDDLPAKIPFEIASMNVRILSKNIGPQQGDVIPGAHAPLCTLLLSVQGKAKKIAKK